MPELPEVETVARMLAPHLQGRVIRRVDVHWARSVATPDVATFREQLRGARIESVARRGKYLIFALDPRAYLLTHLRMSGRYLLGAEAAQHVHLRVLFLLDDDTVLAFVDPRKFGRLYLTAALDEPLAGLGPEPLSSAFTVEHLTACLARRKVSLKVALLDQRCVAGLGNIYACEALWQAQLAPQRRADSLSADDVARLHDAIQTVLRAAIVNGGTSLADRQYVFPDGGTGSHQLTLAVYGRAGEACPRCGAPVQRVVLAQRGTYFCAACQH